MEDTETYLLTQSEAAVRSSVLSEISYSLRLTLTPHDSFAGLLNIKFTTSDPSTPLWLDFKGTCVTSLSINSSPSPIHHTNSKLSLPGLHPGQNTADISFHNKYSHDGLGLHYYKDPEDGKIYLYSQFEPFSANRMFPCFDQPDLKATLDLLVKAPASWKVISNEIASSKVPAEKILDMPVVDEYVPEEPEKVHVFPGKYRISTYLYVICAGHYAKFRKDSNEVNIPLGLYCRQSMAQYMVPDRYFHWTIEGFKFYQKFFDFPYPFSKYDGVFAPEFNHGAMENVGCVTYRDQYIFKDHSSWSAVPHRWSQPQLCCADALPVRASCTRWRTCGLAIW